MPVVNCVRVASIFINDEWARTLLTKRKANDSYPFWSNVGGKLDPNESPADAVIREAFEESGVEVRKLSLLAKMVTDGPTPDAPVRLLYIFRADSWCGKPTNKEPGKCDEIGWFDFIALPAPVMPSIRAIREAGGTLWGAVRGLNKHP